MFHLSSFPHALWPTPKQHDPSLSGSEDSMLPFLQVPEPHSKAREAHLYPSWQTISGELSGRDEMRHLKRWASSLGHTCAPQHPPQLPFPSNIWSSLLGISQSSRPVFESLATQTAREKFTGVVYKPGAEVRSLLGVCSSSLQPWTLGKQVDKKPVVLLSHLKTWTSGT